MSADRATMRLAKMVYADYLAHYYRRMGPAWKMRLLAVPRMIINPSLHATILVRCFLASPRWLGFVWRNLLITKHSMDIGRGCQIGPGLHLPHPFGVVLGTRVRIGTNVMLYHNVTMGVSRAPKVVDDDSIYLVPSVGDNVVVHPNCVIAGGVFIGDNAIIGANTFVDRDVPAGTTFHGNRDGRSR